MNRYILILSVLLSGCGQSNEPIPPTVPQMERVSAVANAGAEATPIVFNGQRYIISFGGRQDAGGGIIVADFQGNVVTHVSMPNMATGSAIIENGVIYIYGSTGVTVQGTLTHGNQIIMSMSVDLFNWTTPVVVQQMPPDVGTANTSVTKTPDGYVMAYDFTSPGFTNYSYRFLFSTDLTNWSPVGGTFRGDQYTSCPTIRWMDGQYYLFYLDKARQNNYTAYFTKMARSADLVNFEYQSAPYAVISPGPGEGTAVTDLDLVEDGGVTYFIYSAGDQQTWGEEHISLYRGTLSEFVKLFF